MTSTLCLAMSSSHKANKALGHPHSVHWPYRSQPCLSLRSLSCCLCFRSGSAPPTPPTVDGQWQEWSQWSDCSVTCANGTQQRTRQCSAAAHGGSECRGHWAESRECFNPDCTGGPAMTPHTARGCYYNHLSYSPLSRSFCFCVINYV